METKICTKCGIEKELDEFYNKITGKLGKTSQCKKCIIKFREENKDKIRERKKKYCDNNKDKIIERNKENREKNGKKYYKEYHENNKDRRNELKKIRMKNDINFKLRNALSSRIRKVLRNKETNKTNKIINLIGCNVDELKYHLELLFKPGMTWENHGEWHIDHILPCAAFDLRNSEEQEICFHWTNLQPLWAKENISKGDKII